MKGMATHIATERVICFTELLGDGHQYVYFALIGYYTSYIELDANFEARLGQLGLLGVRLDECDS